MNNYYLKGLKLLCKWAFSNPGRGTPPALELVNPKPASAHNPTFQRTSTCIPCSIDHTATVCGVLNESLRFARREGISNSEVQVRIAKAEEELNTMERLDLDAKEIAKLPKHQKGLVSWLAQQSKDLRDRLKDINTLEDLESVTADACDIRLKFRTKSLGLPDEVADISRKVASGEMTGKEAMGKIKELVGPEKK